MTYKLLDFEGLKYFLQKLGKIFIFKPQQDNIGGFLQQTNTGYEWVNLPGMLHYQGTVADYEHLPAQGNEGDVYTTTDTGLEYFWKITDNSTNPVTGCWDLFGSANSGNDKYKSAFSNDTKSVAVGGIAANTKLENISPTENPKTISQVLDMILFPAYAPQFKEASISFPSNFPSIKFVYSSIEANIINDYSVSVATTYVGSKVVNGGLISANPNYTITKNSTAYQNSIYDSIGDYKYTLKCDFNAGTTVIKNSQENPATGYASNASTLDVSNNTSRDALYAYESGYAIAARTNIQSEKTVKVINPVWIYGIDETPNQRTMLTEINSNTIQSTGLRIKLKAVTGSNTPEENWQIDIPHGKKLQVSTYNFDGTLNQIDNSIITQWKSSNNIDSEVFNNNTIKIDRYVFKGQGSAAQDYFLKITD